MQSAVSFGKSFILCHCKSFIFLGNNGNVVTHANEKTVRNKELALDKPGPSCDSIPLQSKVSSGNAQPSRKIQPPSLAGPSTVEFGDHHSKAWLRGTPVKPDWLKNVSDASLEVTRQVFIDVCTEEIDKYFEKVAQNTPKIAERIALILNNGSDMGLKVGGAISKISLDLRADLSMRHQSLFSKSSVPLLQPLDTQLYPIIELNFEGEEQLKINEEQPMETTMKLNSETVKPDEQQINAEQPLKTQVDLTIKLNFEGEEQLNINAEQPMETTSKLNSETEIADEQQIIAKQPLATHKDLTINLNRENEEQLKINDKKSHDILLQIVEPAVKKKKTVKDQNQSNTKAAPRRNIRREVRAQFSETAMKFMKAKQ